MKRSELKQLIKEVITEMYQQETSFNDTADINMAALGKGNYVLNDIEVTVEVQGNYEDNRFDWEAGDTHGTHDPGSGFMAEELKVLAVEDVYEYDDDGNPIMEKKVFGAGQEIPESALTKESLKRLNDIADEKLQAAAEYDPREDEPREDI